MKIEPEIEFPIEPNFDEDFAPLTTEDYKIIKEIKRVGYYAKQSLAKASQRVLLIIFEDLSGQPLIEAVQYLHPRYRVWCINEYNDIVERLVVKSLSINGRLNFIRNEHRIAKTMIQELPVELLPEFIYHKDSNVRHVVSRRIDPVYLPYMMDDKNVNVRASVIQRIDPSYLVDMMVNDQNCDLIPYIIERIDPDYLYYYINTGNDDIRTKVASKIDLCYLPDMMNDKARTVRVEVARRLDPALLGPMLGDSTSEVREMAYERILPEVVPKRYLKKFNERVAAKIMST